MSDSSDAGSAPKKQRIVTTLEGKVELLDMYHRLRFAAVVSCHFRTNESTIRTTVKRKKKRKKKKREFVKPSCSHTRRHNNTALFVKYFFVCRTEKGASMWRRDCWMKSIPMGPNMI